MFLVVGNAITQDRQKCSTSMEGSVTALSAAEMLCRSIVESERFLLLRRVTVLVLNIEEL